MVGFRLVMAYQEVGHERAVEGLLHNHMDQEGAAAVAGEPVVGVLLLMMDWWVGGEVEVEVVAVALELVAGFRLVMTEGVLGDEGEVRHLLGNHMG